MLFAHILIFGIAFGMPVAAFIITFTYIAFHPDFDGKPRYECCECGGEFRSLSPGHRCLDCEIG